MEKDILVIKISNIEKGDTLKDRAAGNWAMRLSSAEECKRAVVIRNGIILNAYKIVDVWETEQPAKNIKENNRVRFQLAECRDYSYLIGKKLKWEGSNPVTRATIEEILDSVS
jgi:hypothetical protein